MSRHEQFSSIGQKIDPRDPYITKKRKINQIIFHCTATPWGQDCGAKRVDEMHIQRFGKFSGCGYHFVINVDGSVEIGRWSDYPGAHAKGYNSNTIGVAYAGGVDKFGRAMVQGLNEAQYRTAKTLARALLKGYELDVKDFVGHNELPHVNKGCPCTPMETFRSYL